MVGPDGPSPRICRVSPSSQMSAMVRWTTALRYLPMSWLRWDIFGDMGGPISILRPFDQRVNISPYYVDWKHTLRSFSLVTAVKILLVNCRTGVSANVMAWVSDQGMYNILCAKITFKIFGNRNIVFDEILPFWNEGILSGNFISISSAILKFSHFECGNVF